MDKIHYIGHASTWISLDGIDLIVDVNLSDKLFGIIKRKNPIGLDVHHIPDVSALLVTHAHYDHLDIFSYKYFSQEKPLICPPGIQAFINRFIHNPVHELAQNKQHKIGPLTISAVPAKHFGFRISGLRFTKCNGYIIEGKNHTIYHAGDSAYGSHFKEIGKKYKIDVALLPIGAYRPRWFMKSRHMNPEEALQAFEDLGAKTMIPIHWGSFRLSFDRVGEPLERFKKVLDQSPLKDQVKILQPGESYALEN